MQTMRIKNAGAGCKNQPPAFSSANNAAWREEQTARPYLGEKETAGNRNLRKHRLRSRRVQPMPPAPSSFDGSDSVALPLFPLFLPTNPQILAHALPFGLYWPFLSRFFLLLKTESFLSAFKNRGGFSLPCLWPQGLPISKPFRLFLRVQTDLFCSLLQAHTSQEVSHRLTYPYRAIFGIAKFAPIPANFI